MMRLINLNCTTKNITSKYNQQHWCWLYLDVTFWPQNPKAKTIYSGDASTCRSVIICKLIVIILLLAILQNKKKV